MRTASSARSSTSSGRVSSGTRSTPGASSRCYSAILVGRHWPNARFRSWRSRPRPRRTEERDAPPLGPLPAGRPTPVGCGFNLTFYSHDTTDDFNEFYIDAAAESGCEWIRLQFTWRDLQPREGQPVSWSYWPYERVVEMANERGLKVLVNIAHPPAWALPGDKRFPARPDAFESFTTELVTLLAGKVDAWQIWNEPNLIAESNGIIDPAGFLPILRAGYTAVKAADPNALVVFPGLAPNTMMLPHLAMSDGWYLETLLGINNGEAAELFRHPRRPRLRGRERSRYLLARQSG